MEELDLKELISIFMKRKVLIIMVVIIFALVGAIYTLKFITPVYTSETRLVLVQAGTENNLQGDSTSITTSDVTLNSKLVDSYIEIATSPDKVLSKVIQNLNLDMTIEKLESIVEVSQKVDTNVIIITVKHTDPELSCNIANEIAKTFVGAVEDIYKLSNLSVLDAAKVPQEPSNIHLAKNVLIFAFVGGIIVSGYILLINMLDTTVKSDVDIEKTVNLPVLASIVFTNDNVKKSSHMYEDIYKVSDIDNENEYTVEEPTKEHNSSLFEITTNESNINNPIISSDSKFRPRKKNRNRRNK